MKKKVIYFDRFSGNDDLLKTLYSQINFNDFASHAFSGDYQGETGGTFLKDTDKRGDRFCTLHFSKLVQKAQDQAPKTDYYESSSDPQPPRGYVFF